MNEILYRQKLPYQEVWHEWGFIDGVDDGFYGPETEGSHSGTYPESFQFTGFYDSTRTDEFPKGKRIWRGSILALCNTTGVVKWDTRTGWMVWFTDGREEYWPLYDCLDNPVIGNTTENPEMI